MIKLPTPEPTGHGFFSFRVRGSAIFRHTLYSLAVVLTSAASVLSGEYLINRFYFGTPTFFAGAWLALVLNVLILCCFIYLLLTLANRLFLAVFLGVLSYGFLIMVDVIKLTYLDDPVRPTDFQYLSDLRAIAGVCIHARSVVEILAGSMFAAGLSFFLWRREPPALPRHGRRWAGVAAVGLLLLLFTLPSIDAAHEWLVTHGIADPMGWHFEPRASAQLNGLLVEWAMSTADPEIIRPAGYNRSEIERIASEYRQQQALSPAAQGGPRINLIIYLVESFMDPMDLGVRYTYDPIPTFRAISRRHSSGKVVVPVFGGTSANTEFELLTGLSMYFLPEWSCPYRQYISRDIPSLPRVLRAQGYKTTAVVADPPYLFNRKAVFAHLGFDRWIFPASDPKTPRSPDPEFASDSAIVDAAIAASRGSSPYFIFAFTSGSHFPWDYPDYDNSRLDIVSRMPGPARSRLKTYVNALNVADRSLKRLLDHFKNVDQKTAILIMGDHLPALGDVYDRTRFFSAPLSARIQRRYRVPAVLWCNWRESKEDFVCSMNFIAGRLLRFMGLQAWGGMALNSDVYAHFPVLSKYVATSDGRFFLPKAPDLPHQSLLNDYRLIQYDVLKGSQYATGISGW